MIFSTAPTNDGPTPPQSQVLLLKIIYDVKSWPLYRTLFVIASKWITVKRLMSSRLAEKTKTCNCYSLYLPACPSPRVHSVMQHMTRKVRQGKKRVDRVTAAPVVYTPLPCLVSVTPPLALGQNACQHLCANCTSRQCSIHALLCWHQDSLLLPVDMSAYFPSLYLSVWMGFFPHLNIKGMNSGSYLEAHGRSLCIFDNLIDYLNLCSWLLHTQHI